MSFMPDDEPKNATIGGAQLAAPASQLENEMQELDKETAMLGETLAILDNRLNPIMTPVEPTDRTDGETPRPTRSPLTDGISIISSRVRANRHRIERILERLEV